MTRNLLALATAGVLTVYAAGYARTESAAEDLGAGADGRRQDGAASGAARSPAGSAPAAVAAADASPTGPAEAPVAPGPGDASAPAAVAAPPATVPTGDPATVPGTAGVSLPATAREAPPAAYKDGLYTGWGSSLHGRIEATVEIRGGRILSAKISTCRTRWPCARIAYLVPQVAERQSPEVDVITGATHSSDAFYYALVEALSNAK